MTVCGTEWLCEWSNVRTWNRQPLECCSGSPAAFHHVLCSSYRACTYNQHIIQQMNFTIQHTWHTFTAACFGIEVPSSGSYYKHRCTSQPAIIHFVHSYEHNYIWFLKYIKLLKYAKLIVMMIYSIVMYYSVLIISRVVCQFLVSLRYIGGWCKHWL